MKFNELYENLINNIISESKNDLTGSYSVNITHKALQNVFNKALNGEEFEFFVDLDSIIYRLTKDATPLEEFDIKGKNVIHTTSSDWSKNKISLYKVFVKLNEDQVHSMKEFSKTGSNFINTQMVSQSMSMHDEIRKRYDKNTLTYMKENFKISKFKNVKRKNETLQEAVNRYISNVLATMLKIQNKKFVGIKNYKLKPGEYYHVSYNDYDIGDSIIPTRTKKEIEAMGKGTLGIDPTMGIENTIENHRPSSKPPRIGSVYLFESAQDAQDWFRKFSNNIPSKIYVAKVAGKSHRANMLLVDAIESKFNDIRDLGVFDETEEDFAETKEQEKEIDDEITQIAKTYWKGDDGKEWVTWKRIIWEIVAQNAQVTAILS